MDPETREAFTTAHGRIDKTEETLLELAKQMSELVGIHKAQAEAKASEKPGPTFMQQQWTRLKFDVGKIIAFGLIVYFWTHSTGAH